MAKILVIEDDANIRENICEFLELNDYSVVVAVNGKEGLLLANEFKPDLIICDIMMPKLSGYEVKENLAVNPVTSKIPFIFLTAKTDLKDIREGMMLGADDYIVKPFKNDELLKSIEVRLSRISELASSVEQAPPDENYREGKVMINVNGKPVIIEIDEIEYIASSGDYTTVYLKDQKKYFIRKLLNQWEKILPKNDFIKIHRSTIININSIARFEKWYNRSYRIYLKNVREPLTISKSHLSELKSRFSF
ncbi:MAG: response regulator [Ignavibacteria bacterium]|jgi:DNA-binding LytR/AlgR family response regulator